jgi:hypothetical protein
MPEKDKDKGPQTPIDTPQDLASPGPLAPKEEPKEEPKKLDETMPGGKYKTPDGRTVNANGEPIDESGKVIKPS